jgi:pimeloyl-ACP methyl ester carboxylesterase
MITSSRTYEGKPGVIAYDYCPGTPDPSLQGKSRIAISVSPNGSDIPSAPPEDTCAAFAHDANPDVPGQQDSWQEAALKLGFAVYTVTYADSWDYVQRNALALVDLFQQLSAEGRLSKAADVVLVGASMGGLVARYALQYMEANGIPHDVDLWVADDSPLHGAYVPLGVQFLDQYFADVWGVASAKAEKSQILDSPFARQALIHHYSASDGGQAQPTPEFQQLFGAELGGTLGEFPSAPGLTTIALSNGRGDGGRDDPGPASQILQWTSNWSSINGLGSAATVSRKLDAAGATNTATITITPASDGYDIHVKVTRPFLLTTITLFEGDFHFTLAVSVTVSVHASSAASSPASVFSATPLFQLNGQNVDLLDTDSVRALMKQIVKTQIPAGVANINWTVWDAIGDTVLQSPAQSTVDAVKSYVGAHPEYGFADVKVATAYSYEGGPGGRSNKSGEAIDLIAQANLGSFSGAQQRDHDFIPVSSALLLSGDPGAAVSPANSPFDEIHYAADGNSGHLSNVQFEDGRYAYEIITGAIARVVQAGLQQ